MTTPQPNAAGKEKEAGGFQQNSRAHGIVRRRSGMRSGREFSFTLMMAAWLTIWPGSGYPSTLASGLPAAGLVSWWSADGDASDVAGGNNGHLHSGAAFAPGVVGQAFSFDG